MMARGQILKDLLCPLDAPYWKVDVYDETEEYSRKVRNSTSQKIEV